MNKERKTTYFYDTSALLLTIDEVDFNSAVISDIIISELENIKNNAAKDDYTKARARLCVRRIMEEKSLDIFLPDKRKINKILEKWAHLMEPKNDSYLLCEADLYSKMRPNEELIFITADYCQWLLANTCFKDSFTAKFISEKSETRIEDGFKRIIPTDEQFKKLSNENCSENIFDLKTNEYVILESSGGARLGYARWDGKMLVQLGYKDIKSPLFGKIHPRNAEQKIYMDLLQNADIPIVSCVSRRGTGKTFLAMVNGLDMVERGYYDKVLYLRNNWELTGTNELGALPGTEDEKVRPYMGPIMDIVGGEEMFDELVEQGKIDFMHLGFTRGRSFSNTFIIVDEAQNCSTNIVQTIIGRMGENTKVVFCGDFKQIDSKLFSRDSGLLAMNNKFFGNELYGQVRLKKIERSKVCQMCDLLD